MTGKPKNIGELFKVSFEDFEVKGDNSDWSMLEMKLEKVKFFRFDLTCFNIYYASLIALTFIFSSTVLIDHFLVSKEEAIQLESREGNIELQQSINEDSNKNSVVFSKDSTTIKQNKLESDRNTSDGSASENLAPSFVITPPENNASFVPNKDNNDQESNIGKVVLNPSSALLLDTLSSDTTKKKAPVEKKVQEKALQKKIIYITKQDTVIVIDSIKTKSKRKK